MSEQARPDGLFVVTFDKAKQALAYNKCLWAGPALNGDVNSPVFVGSASYALGDPLRMCCKHEACAMCTGQPPCKGPVDPKQFVPDFVVDSIKLGGGAQIGYAPDTDMDEVHFNDTGSPRIPVLSSSGMAAQLRRWHNIVFGPNQMVAYHIYRIAFSTTAQGAQLGLLSGHHIAIPVEPDPPQSAFFKPSTAATTKAATKPKRAS